MGRIEHFVLCGSQLCPSLRKSNPIIASRNSPEDSSLSTPKLSEDHSKETYLPTSPEKPFRSMGDQGGLLSADQAKLA